MTSSITLSMKLILMQDISDEHLPTAGLTHIQCKVTCSRNSRTHLHSVYVLASDVTHVLVI